MTEFLGDIPFVLVGLSFVGVVGTALLVTNHHFTLCLVFLVSLNIRFYSSKNEIYFYKR